MSKLKDNNAIRIKKVLSLLERVARLSWAIFKYEPNMYFYSLELDNTHMQRVCFISEKQNVRLYRHKRQVCHIIEIFDAAAVAGLNCKPQGPLHTPSSFPFVYLQSSQIAAFSQAGAILPFLLPTELSALLLQFFGCV